MSKISAMPVINADLVADIVYVSILDCATSLRPDCADALDIALKAADADSREHAVLQSMVDNNHIAQLDRVPLCQDTGYAWVLLEAGPDVLIPGDVFSKVNDAVAKAYTKGNLRKSIVCDAAFDRTNTNDNTPAFCEVKLTETPGCRISVMLKGGGSDNASRVVMLSPSAGLDGIIDEVEKCVREKAANACPPLTIGVGIGATFDKVASLAKHALLRDVNEPTCNPCAKALEDKILDRVNSTMIGAGALGGNVTAYRVFVETAPCHIAALPLAINMGCSAMRSKTTELVSGNTWQEVDNGD